MIIESCSDEKSGECLTVIKSVWDGINQRPFDITVIEGSEAVRARKLREQDLYDFDPSRFMEEPNATN